jgi:hypothetical protein
LKHAKSKKHWLNFPLRAGYEMDKKAERDQSVSEGLPHLLRRMKERFQALTDAEWEVIEKVLNDQGQRFYD